ncbi:magnesium transporter CorA family protein [Candidatus Kaiserbacteria bacterium]|nr:magnesium transporter CorA family protein [Candidatus Kaiserbacteria bacterium]
MIFRYEYPGGVWVDLERPSTDEIQQIAQEFSINERIKAELIFPTPTPLVAQDEHMTLLVLHFPAHETDGGETKNQEIDFVVGSNFILTVRYDTVVSLHHLKKVLETQKLVGERGSIATDVLLEILFAHLYTSARDHTNHLASNLSRVEHDMFDGHNGTTVRLISDISREFLHLNAALADQEETLTFFLKMLTSRDFFGASFAERSDRILTERIQVMRFVGTHRAIANELRETNTALLGARQNEIMKTLTTITVLVLPLELIASVLVLHLPGTPLLDNPNAFFIVLAIMLASVGLTTLFFVRKRWIF